MKPDEFHYHEAMDRSLTIQTMIDMLLIEHPAIEAHKSLTEKVLDANALLADIYQECGRLRSELFPEGDGL